MFNRIYSTKHPNHTHAPFSIDAQQGSDVNEQQAVDEQAEVGHESRSCAG